MLHQFLRPFIFLMRTYIYPSTIQRIADDFLALGNEFLNKVSGMEEGIIGNLCQSTLLDEIYAGICIVVILHISASDTI